MEIGFGRLRKSCGRQTKKCLRNQTFLHLLFMENSPFFDCETWLCPGFIETATHTHTCHRSLLLIFHQHFRLSLSHWRHIFPCCTHTRTTMPEQFEDTAGPKKFWGRGKMHARLFPRVNKLIGLGGALKWAGWLPLDLVILSFVTSGAAR